MPTRLAPLAFALIACAAIAAPANPAQREIATARIHATVATQIDNIQGVHLHLHHVINCLVGPHGNGWDAAAEAVSENHCTGLGHGAIADSNNDPAVHRLAETALRDAQAGVKAGNLGTAHRDAHEALEALEEAEQRAATTP
ncbi:MAG: hypothetical protein ACREPF_03040 [Rhodanobacteraceae bacterium]